MRIVVGLGNPGPGYGSTRHNVGFLVVDEVRRRHGDPAEERASRSLCAVVSVAGIEILLARPQTYMNRSGLAVAALLERRKAGPADLLVVCDDFYLAFGGLRLRPRGSHGGHQGLRSVIESLGTQEFARLRVGVGPPEPEQDHADFVLAPFGAPERRRLREVVETASDCVEAAVSDGIERAMGRFNRRQAPDVETTGAR